MVGNLCRCTQVFRAKPSSQFSFVELISSHLWQSSVNACSNSIIAINARMNGLQTNADYFSGLSVSTEPRNATIRQRVIFKTVPYWSASIL
jgi:hypothetical protein